MTIHKIFRARAGLAAICVGTAALAFSAAPAAAAAVDPDDSTLSAVPSVRGPIAVTDDSYLWSTTQHARVPFDVADFGFVEEEFFLSGAANVYDHVDGEVTVVEESVPYTNYVLVRRPADAADASGIVLVDVLNASNGFPGEDHWRRMWDWALEEGHTIIGVGSKSIQIDALHNFDAERYADLSWDMPGAEDRAPLIADPADPSSFNPHMVIEGAEEGLTWDITTQLGVLLENEPERILGDVVPNTTLLLGQSQSGLNVNTYAANFHDAQAASNGGSVWDGYLSTVGGFGQRALKQGGVADTSALRGFDVPFISISAEGDTGLFSTVGLAERDMPANRYQWQVPGTPHTDLLSPVIPADEEIYKAGRLPNTQVHDQEFRDALNLYPLEPAIIAGAEALIAAHEDGAAIAGSLWLDQADGELVRDASGNATGGVRYGLIELPLGQYLGAAAPGAVFGSMDLITAEEFADTYGTRADYLAQMSQFDAGQIEAGYLTAYGAQYLLDVANTLLDRIGVPVEEPVTEEPVTEEPVVEEPVVEEPAVEEPAAEEPAAEEPAAEEPAAAQNSDGALAATGGESSAGFIALAATLLASGAALFIARRRLSRR